VIASLALDSNVNGPYISGSCISSLRFPDDICTAAESNDELQQLVMAALRSRCGRYIFVLSLLFFFFFPRLISAVADWMSTVLSHMVWP